MLSLRTLALAAGLALLAPPALAFDFTSGSGLPLNAFGLNQHFDWSGGYFGYNAGAVSGSVKLTGNGGPSSFTTNGFTGGSYGGYNYQLGPMVTGVEGEVNFNDPAGGRTANFNYGGAPASDAISESGNYEGRIRARLGVASNNMLYYAAGGWTVGDVKMTSVLTASGINNGSAYLTTQSQISSGWNIGAGAEYAITNNWIVRGEYIRDQFKPVSYAFDGIQTPKASSVNNTMRMGLAYKF